MACHPLFWVTKVLTQCLFLMNPYIPFLHMFLGLLVLSTTLHLALTNFPPSPSNVFSLTLGCRRVIIVFLLFYIVTMLSPSSMMFPSSSHLDKPLHLCLRSCTFLPLPMSPVPTLLLPSTILEPFTSTRLAQVKHH